jgi:hypothetical protein
LRHIDDAAFMSSQGTHEEGLFGQQGVVECSDPQASDRQGVLADQIVREIALAFPECR